MKKTKLFLGAYIDSINAQDINCYHIAKYIDKTIFDVHVLVYATRGTYMNIPGVTCHVIRKNRILKNIDKLKIMYQIDADIYYLPRVEKVDILFAKFNKKCVVSSVEIQTVYTNKKYKLFFNKFISGYFCISNYLNLLNEKFWGKRVPVLYLGVANVSHVVEHNNLKTIVFVGSIVDRKRPQYFLRLAEEFSDLKFVMIGDGYLLQQLKEIACLKKIGNIEFLGKLDNHIVLNKLKESDLLVITSEREGLPKVVLEAASQGVPSIYIDEYYSIDYIINGVNGYAVKNIDEMIERIMSLKKETNVYKKMSKKVFELADQYNWDRLIVQYEKFFLETYEKTLECRKRK